MPRDRFFGEVRRIAGRYPGQPVLERARDFQETHTHKIDDRTHFYAYFTPRNIGKTGNSRRLCHVPLVRHARCEKQD